MGEGVDLPQNFVVEFHLATLAGPHILSYETYPTGQHLDGTVLGLQVLCHCEKMRLLPNVLMHLGLGVLSVW